MSDTQIKSAYDKGNSPAVIAKLLDYDISHVNQVLGLNEVASSDIVRVEFSPSALEAVASEALYELACDVKDNPQAFKPAEALAIIREALDRTKGKAAQMMTIESKSTVTHAHVMSIDPVDAYRLLIEGKAQVSGLPIIEVTPEIGGGIPQNTAPGVVCAKATPQNTHGSGIF